MPMSSSTPIKLLLPELSIFAPIDLFEPLILGVIVSAVPVAAPSKYSCIKPLVQVTNTECQLLSATKIGDCGPPLYAKSNFRYPLSVI